jgi:hypothetical protein
MKTLLAAATLVPLAIAALAAEPLTPTGAAPFTLTDAQMDQVRAGAFIYDRAQQQLYHSGQRNVTSDLQDVNGTYFEATTIAELATFGDPGVRIWATTAGDQTGYLDTNGNIWCCGNTLGYNRNGYTYGKLQRIGRIGNHGPRAPRLSRMKWRLLSSTRMSRAETLKVGIDRYT